MTFWCFLFSHAQKTSAKNIANLYAFFLSLPNPLLSLTFSLNVNHLAAFDALEKRKIHDIFCHLQFLRGCADISL